MKYLTKLFLPLFRKYLIAAMTNESNKTYVVTKISDHIKLPNLSEEQERQVIDKVYDAIAEITKAYLEKND